MTVDLLPGQYSIEVLRPEAGKTRLGNLAGAQQRVRDENAGGS